MMNWRDELHTFITDDRGAASVFLVTLLPLFLSLGGLAIDAASAYRTRAQLQSAADAASLAAVISLPDVTKAKQNAIAYADANVPNAPAGTVLQASNIVTGTWNPTTQTFTAGTTPVNAVQVVVSRSEASGNAQPTSFLKLIGIDHFDVAAAAISTTSQPNLRVAMVLDNTGSMSDADSTHTTKLSALKTAANQLLGMLQGDSVTPGDVQVAVVPFTRDVKIGTSKSSAVWLSFSDFVAAPPAPAQSVGPNSSCPWSDNSQGYHCTSGPTNGAGQVSKIPNSGTYKGYICPSATAAGHYWNGCFDSVAIKGKSNQYTHTWHTNATSTWTGCVTDRTQDYDVNNTTPTTAVPATLMVAENTPSCPASAVMPLSYDWANLSKAINNMTASGSTNQTVGLEWGWHALTQGDPLDPPAPAPLVKTERIIILLSDGFNTQDRWYGNGTNQSTQVDNRMKLACANAKADGVEIYTVAVDIAGDFNVDLLKQCASDPVKNFFDVKTSNDIETAFQEIGRRITALRIVR